MDTSHLEALRIGLLHERARLASAKKPGEIALRKVWVAQYEKEVAQELAFLGITEPHEVELSDDELLAVLIK